MTEKEFGSLTRQELRHIYALYHGHKADKTELSSLLRQKKSRLNKIINLGGSWGQLYALSPATIMVWMFYFAGLLEPLQEAVRQEDRLKGLMDFLESDAEPGDIGEENEAAFIVLFMALMGNMQALESYAESMEDMLRRVEQGDDEALFRAVRTDRASVQAEPIAQRICLAHLTEDEAFMNSLAKAITRTKPRPQKKELDDTRFILALLNDSVGLDKLVNSTVDELIADDLQALPGSNSYSRISKLLTEVRAKSKK